MWRTQVSEVESRVEAEKHIKCKGTARVRLKSLCFRPNLPHEWKEPDRKNVERLKAIFRRDLSRLHTRNHVAAVIEEEDLAAAIRLSGITVAQLTRNSSADVPEPISPSSYPELVFPAGYQLEYLQGQDRIQAAKELRLEWWTVDLYLAGRMAVLCNRTSLTKILPRPLPQPENIFGRGICQRKTTKRWRDLPQDSSVPFPAEFAL